MRRPEKPAATVKRARQLRRTLSKPEAMLWSLLRTAPGGFKFRRQHPAGPYVLDFYCAKAALAIEIDGYAHDTGDRPEHDLRRDLWLREHRIETLRIPARAVLDDAVQVADGIMRLIAARLEAFATTPPSAFQAATSPSLNDGEDNCR